jgi:hypothetical protein
MMKSPYKINLTRKNFRPLKNFRYNPFFHPSVASNKQLVLAKNLSRSYGITEINILRLIMYADFALSYAHESEIQVQLSDLKDISEFEESHEEVKKIVFSGQVKSFEITNPHLIDELYKSMQNFIEFHRIRKKKPKKKQSSDSIVKKLANELYIELTEIERISEWRSLCIIGYIFCHYDVCLDSEEPIMTEEKFNLSEAEKRESTETYLQYLSARVKQYINS